jgi:hypothetical protein
MKVTEIEVEYEQTLMMVRGPLFKKFPNLERIKLSMNQISCFVGGFLPNKHLVELNLFNNKLQDFPSDLFQHCG